MLPNKKLTSWTNTAEVSPVMRRPSSWRTRRDLGEDLLRQDKASQTKSRRRKGGVASCCSTTGGCLWTTEEEQEETSPLILGKASKMEERSKRRKGAVVSSGRSKDSSYPQEDFPWINQVGFFIIKKRNSLFLCIDRSVNASETEINFTTLSTVFYLPR